MTAVVLTFVSAVASAKEESVLNAVQLLWVNLIMDTFAALALATDPPNRSVLDRKPDRKSAPLITLRMGKMIIGQAICQLGITLVLNFAGFHLLGYDTWDDKILAQKRLNTLIFNTFVWLQIFNELNNRRLDNKLNVFESIHRNWFFIIINIIMVGGQVLIIFVAGDAFKIKPLDGKEWGMSIGLGAISLPWGALIRKFPDLWVAKMLPKRMRRRYAPDSLPESERQPEALPAAEKPVDTDTDDEQHFRPPLRMLTSIRGSRVEKNIHNRRHFRDRMHDYKAKIKETVRGDAPPDGGRSPLLPGGKLRS